jgi:hypothetical protein
MIKTLAQWRREKMALEEKKQFAADIVRIKAKAGQLGLFKTMQALEAGVKAVGWEIAEHIEKEEEDD